jgi:hypothetical protein
MSAVTAPLVPTAGPAQVPGVAVQEANVVPAGSGSLSATASAASGPRFVIVMAYVSGRPGSVGLLEAVFATTRSALAPGAGVGVRVGVPVTGVKVGVAVAEPVRVGVGVSVWVGVAVEVTVAVAVAVPVGVFVTVFVGVTVNVRVGVFVNV